MSGSQAKDPNAYWRKLKQRLKAEGSEVVTIVTDWIEKLNLQGFLVTSLSTQSSAQSSARENFFSKKYTHTETIVIQMLPRVVYTISPTKISNIQHKNTKTLSIQHHYNI